MPVYRLKKPASGIWRRNYIIPPIPPPAGIGGVSSLMFATTASVVSNVETAVRTRLDRRGNPCGFVTIEDFDGSGELALFGEDWGHWSGMLTEGASVYITAKLQPRFQNSSLMGLKVASSTCALALLIFDCT